MTNAYLNSIIPADNRLDVALSRATAFVATDILQAAYQPGSGFVGVFMDDDGQPTWARRAARYLDDEFDDSGGTLMFGDVLSSITDNGAGKCLPNFRHAIDLWKAGGGVGVKPFNQRQQFGSCVDASVGSHESALFGWRAKQPTLAEEYRLASGWLKYCERGYCSDGWNGAGAATAAKKVGCAFRQQYTLPGGSVDFSNNDINERTVAREWCRSGVPDWMKAETLKHAYDDGAITRFQGGVKELRAAFAAGGVVHTSGTRTSGGSKPFTIGSVGPHMQSGIGCDDSDEFRKFCRDVIGVTTRPNDFPVVMDQTWGTGWRGECADAYWPPWWGEKPEGAWVWWASDVLSRLSCDFVWLPRVKGFPSSEPPTPPTDRPRLDGSLRVNGTVISGIVEAATDIPKGTRFTSSRYPSGEYKLVRLDV